MTTKEVRNKNPRKLRAGRAFGDPLSIPSFYKDGARSLEVPKVRNPLPPAHRPSSHTQEAHGVSYPPGLEILTL